MPRHYASTHATARQSRRLSGRLCGAAIAALIALGATACGGLSADPAAGLDAETTTSSTAASSPTATSTKADTDKDLAVDFRPLLIKAEHLSDGEDTFTARSVDTNPNGMPGASAFFVNAEDDRAIANTILLYPDAETAQKTLQAATESLPTKVIGGTPRPAPVGTDGVVISGTSPEGDTAVTQLLFTEGRALVRLDFESAVGDTTTDQFVNNVGKMQLIALQTGLRDTE
ncbi:hypothetical protein [[Mycobacterium] burgundiense]|uniref:Lipoprotein n=1 Tax=[Mycobacterium] burgundiense TaxID=3064286 RepID=A0ABN9MVE6_9MYCO|nr:hypothetical protein [Mycolicibacterium sp. MU0053]CAJ1495690.1 hypothetical protein MU0053_000460 [Mycolicibacterium sp. MU0053]